MYYQTIIRSSQGIGNHKEDLFGFKTYDEALDYCETNHWTWEDMNGFLWGLEIEERDGELVYTWEIDEGFDEADVSEVREYTATYAPDTDITFILAEIRFVLPNGDEPYSRVTEVVGFYYGQPDDELTKEYINHRRAEY